MAFCPKCGKKGIKSTFCAECAEGELGLVFKDIIIKKCIECPRIMVRHVWQIFQDENEGIAASAFTKIKNPKNLDLDIDPVYKQLKNKPGAKDDILFEVDVEGQSFEIPGTIEYTYCPKCAKAGSQYFEGTLQLREATPELLAFVRADIAAHAKDGVHIESEKGRGGSADFKLTSTKYMRQLGKKLKVRFNGELTETVKLFSRNRQTSKEIYRTNVLFKLRKNKVGDVVDYRGRKIRIKSIGKRVSGIDVDTGKKVFVED